MAEGNSLSSAPGSKEEENAFEAFISTGKQLNYKMKYQQSMMCFTSALRLMHDKYQFKHKDAVLRCEKSLVFQQDVKSYCDLLTCAVETCLHMCEYEAARYLI